MILGYPDFREEDRVAPKFIYMPCEGMQLFQGNLGFRV